MDYVKKNQRILDEWLKEFIKNGGNEDYFAPDGIMYRGKMEQDENGIWAFSQNKAKENKLWSECPLRILYLLKEQNRWGGDAWDVRCESYHKQYTDEKDYESRLMNFHKHILTSLYGLSNTTNGNKVDYDAIDFSDALKLSDEIPYAKINVKKDAGEGKSDDSVVESEMNKYASFLKKQILNIDSDLIICCNYVKQNQPYHSYILRFLKENVYPDLEKFNDNDWYDKQHNKLVIVTWHASYSFVSEKDYYEKIMSSYEEFLKENPDFLKSHRV